MINKHIVTKTLNLYDHRTSILHVSHYDRFNLSDDLPRTKVI